MSCKPSAGVQPGTLPQPKAEIERIDRLVGTNGLTEAETSATASVIGIVGMQASGVGGPTYYVRHPDDTYSVADPQPTSVAGVQR